MPTPTQVSMQVPMHAAIVDAFARPPRYGGMPAPEPAAGEVRVRVAAAAASPLVRAQAGGWHYSSPARPPFVPGVDGVGRLDDGRRVYCAFSPARRTGRWPSRRSWRAPPASTCPTGWTT